MDTRILRMAFLRDSEGRRFWRVPGHKNFVEAWPAAVSYWQAPAVTWPSRDRRGKESVTTARIDHHRTGAKRAIRELLASLPAGCSA